MPRVQCPRGTEFAAFDVSVVIQRVPHSDGLGGATMRAAQGIGAVAAAIEVCAAKQAPHRRPDPSPIFVEVDRQLPDPHLAVANIDLHPEAAVLIVGREVEEPLHLAVELVVPGVALVRPLTRPLEIPPRVLIFRRRQFACTCGSGADRGCLGVWWEGAWQGIVSSEFASFSSSSSSSSSSVFPVPAYRYGTCFTIRKGSGISHYPKSEHHDTGRLANLHDRVCVTAYNAVDVLLVAVALRVRGHRRPLVVVPPENVEDL
mmetsp:Transcript_64557/g.179128  ORF Transcript_64557/g.179128 Transcript_64557/m.179128 type:complete len:260 (+) Transcript_64557:366-1145(+)